MNLQLTDIAVAQLQANTGPIVLSLAKLGSAFNYVPSPTDTNIHGTLVYSTPPGAPQVQTANIVRYSVLMDFDVGPFDFGELGVFNESNQLFALGSWQALQHKIKTTNVLPGNAIRIDMYLSVVGQNYDMWFDTADSGSTLRAANLDSPDLLPAPKDANPNLYIIKGASADQSAFMAFCDRQGLWAFDCYPYGHTREVTVTARSASSITFARPTVPEDLDPSYFGKIIAQFSSGPNYGVCRYAESSVWAGVSQTLNFDAPLMVMPNVGDTVLIFSRDPMSTDLNLLPVATHATLGVVQVGESLTITGGGLLDVDIDQLPVKSVNGKADGDVVLVAADIAGISTVGKTGQYSDLIGAPDNYALPVASSTVLGGVKQGSDGNITISGSGVLALGFNPVKTVASIAPDANGDVPLNFSALVDGLVNPAEIPANGNLNTFLTAGLFYMVADLSTVQNAPASASRTAFTLEVVPLFASSTGDVVQRYVEAAVAWYRQSAAGTFGPWRRQVADGTLPIATTTTTGVVSVGTGLNVSGAGVLSTQIQSVNSKTDQNIILTAADIGAVAVAEKGAELGVATLDARPLPDDEPFLYARVPVRQLTRGAFVSMGGWDASTNTTDNLNVQSLADGGISVVNVGGLFQAEEMPGYMFRVTVGGTTSLDGIAAWDVGDLLVSLDGVWNKIQTSSSGYVLPTATASVLGGVKVGTSLSITSGVLDVAAAGGFTTPYDMPVFIKGVPASNAVLLRLLMVRPVRLVAGLALARASAEFAAAASTVLTIKKGTTNIGTITFAAAGTTGTIAFTTQVDFAAGDVLYITNQATADTTLADISVTLPGLR